MEWTAIVSYQNSAYTCYFCNYQQGRIEAAGAHVTSTTWSVDANVHYPRMLYIFLLERYINASHSDTYSFMHFAVYNVTLLVTYYNSVPIILINF